MIDYFSIALSHGLIALACWRLLARPDLDDGSAGAAPPARSRPWLKGRTTGAQRGEGGPDA